MSRLYDNNNSVKLVYIFPFIRCFFILDPYMQSLFFHHGNVNFLNQIFQTNNDDAEHMGHVCVNLSIAIKIFLGIPSFPGKNAADNVLLLLHAA